MTNQPPSIKYWISRAWDDRHTADARRALETLLDLAGYSAQQTGDPQAAHMVYAPRDQPVQANAYRIAQTPTSQWARMSDAKPVVVDERVVPDTSVVAANCSGGCMVDLLQATAFFLQGGPERAADRNPFGVPLGVSMREWGIARLPIVDHMAGELRQELLKRYPEFAPANRWPGKHEWAICLTHDCDQPYRFAVRATLARCANSFRQARFGRGIYQLAKASYFALQSSTADPYLRAYRDWSRVEQELGIRSCYYFAAWSVRDRDSHPNDCGYRLTDKSVQTVLRGLVDAGMEIGLHASIRARDVPGRFAVEAERLAVATGVMPEGVRHHDWALDPTHPARTWKRQRDEAGLQYDSSLGMNDLPGFRRGCALPHRVWGLDDQYWQLPPTLMDASIFAVKRTPAEYKRLILEHLSMVRRTGSLAVLNWHDYVMAAHALNNAGAMLAECLREVAADSSCWFAIPSEILRWWSKERWKSALSRAA